ncbi:MAG: hypothetical protein R2795_10495 [Saprospiraceae bacterium]
MHDALIYFHRPMITSYRRHRQILYARLGLSSCSPSLYWTDVVAQVVMPVNPSNCGLNVVLTDVNCPENVNFYNPDVFTIQVSNAPAGI